MTATVPVSIFFQLYLLGVPIGSKDSHENTGIRTTAFDVSSHNRDFIEDLGRIQNDQISCKHAVLNPHKSLGKRLDRL